MPLARSLPPLNIQNARNKQIQSALKSSAEHTIAGSSSSTSSSQSGSLSPNLQPPTPPTFPSSAELTLPSIVGNYVITKHNDRDIYNCFHVATQRKYLCKAVEGQRHQETLSAHFRLDAIDQINQIKEILVGETKTYIIYDWSYGDLHSYVREKRRLKEKEAQGLFRQVVQAVDACHEAGVVLRDLKLRRFVFKNSAKTELMLETLDDAFLLEEDDDTLTDKHGCPAYVSPEILTPTGHYSGKAADIWSLGVMLYTMLVGRYPFHDIEPAALFNKIRKGSYLIPDNVSSKAKCLIRALLRMNPNERLTANEALDHPWFKAEFRPSSRESAGSGVNNRVRCSSDKKPIEKCPRVHDQIVPEIDNYRLCPSNSSSDDSVTSRSHSSSTSDYEFPYMFI